MKEKIEMKKMSEKIKKDAEAWSVVTIVPSENFSVLIAIGK